MLSSDKVIMVILFACYILDTVIITSKYDPFVGIGMLYIETQFRMLNRGRVVKWLTVV